MEELKINVEESLVQSIGQASLERQLEDFLQRLIMKKAAEDILSNLKENGKDLINDAKWKVARELAWESSKNKY